MSRFRPFCCARALTVAAASLVLAAVPLAAQGSLPAGVQPSGPIITSGGMSAHVADADFPIPAGHVFKVMWEINVGDTTSASAQLGTIARFYNLHARNGIPLERLHGAGVVHGTGWWALLSDSAFAARFGGKSNPSRVLVEELLASGAKLVLCGQTAALRGVRREELLPGVQLAISAMTALNVLAEEGYRLNPWR
jgi:intracellular sulfur oxidation DsrE/DsrF family protein